HFTFTQDRKHYVCQCVTNDPDENKCCEAKMSAYSGKDKNAPTRASNLKRHLQRFHPEVLKAVDEKDCIQTNEPVPSSSSQTKEQRTLQPSYARYFVSEVTGPMTVDTFKKQIIELVVKDSVPISLFSQPAFMCLNGEMARKLVIEEAFKQKEELKKTLKGRFLFLKMDACTRHRVNYFAINVRFVCDKNEIVTKTLAVKDTKAHHTSEFLQVLVEKVLQDYELKKQQVLSVVTDNASNMISTPKVDSILKRRAGKAAIIDQATRWGSTYLMIQRLVELKTFLVDMANPQLTLNESQWTQVTELEKLLEHPFTVTKKLQAEDLTPGIFLKEWKNLMFCLSQRGGLIASGIATSMKRREELLLQNNILLAAVYVDPMHRINSQEEQEEFGRPATSSPSSSTDEEFNFEKYLDHKDRAKRSRIEESSPSRNTASTFQQNFSCALKEIEKFDRSSKITVQQAIPLYPDIVRDVARVVTALPPTQVSVERLFSALKIIRSDLRASMKEDLTEAILFLRTNL
ncbi:LOW QUALITY PROTEIN: uncharacterized protein ACNLHF_006937, partial [Anomaloglossus baeobatrachus]